MQIIYKENPLATQVILDEHEREILKLKIKIEQLENIIFEAHFELDKNQDEFYKKLGTSFETRLDKARKYLDPDYIYNKEGIDQRIDVLFDWYIKELEGQHGGDCTCFPASCPKCVAEDLVGVHTTKGLDKYAGHAIESAFRKFCTIDEVIDDLKKFDFTPPEGSGWHKCGGWEQHVPRWTKNNQAAIDWLLQYQQTHFAKD